MTKRKQITIDTANLSREDMILILHEMMDCVGAVSNPHELSEIMDIDEVIAARIVKAVSDENKSIIEEKDGDLIQTPDII